MKARRLVIFSIAIATAISAQIPGGFTGAPFSATQTTERIQTLADGTHITQPSQKVVMYRDSAGRTRNEITSNGRTGDPMPVMVQIMDPVAGFRYQLNLKIKVA